MENGLATLTYFYYDAPKATALGWTIAPTGVVATVPVPPAPVGDSARRRRHDASPSCGQAAAGEEAEEAQGADDVVEDILDDDSVEDPEEVVDPTETTKVARLKAEAVSRQHLLTHLPKNPYCPACTWAKTLREQQRKKANKGYNKLKPYAEPTKFGGLCTMEH